MLEPGEYQILFAANPGELAPYSSHIPAAGYERGCSVAVDVVAGEVTELVITEIPMAVGDDLCQLATAG
jgi:hypothetical protein